MGIKPFYKKYIEPFAALFILASLICLVGLLYQENQLQKEISLNCGWGDEDYYCYCQHDEVKNIEIVLNGSLDLFLNDSLGAFDVELVK